MDEELLQMARVEVGERLDRMAATLLALDVGAPAPLEAIDSLFRDAHTIKGTAAILGWEELSAVSHVLEDRLSGCREEGQLPWNLVDPLVKAVYSMHRTLAGEQFDRAAIVSGLGGGEVPAPPQEPQPASRPAEQGFKPPARREGGSNA